MDRIIQYHLVLIVGTYAKMAAVFVVKKSFEYFHGCGTVVSILRCKFVLQLLIFGGKHLRPVGVVRRLCKIRIDQQPAGFVGVHA